MHVLVGPPRLSPALARMPKNPPRLRALVTTNRVSRASPKSSVTSPCLGGFGGTSTCDGDHCRRRSCSSVPGALEEHPFLPARPDSLPPARTRQNRQNVGRLSRHMASFEDSSSRQQLLHRLRRFVGRRTCVREHRRVGMSSPEQLSSKIDLIDISPRPLQVGFAGD
ncbi:hypothetical protein CERSUDRAFT_62985 [Gelatoporia subvermispora B]|uniref:Uncharacterized protein n=1 Tax=Ceriporiopsis subvermispora (strain B) TaxID=914234 RepID=M2RRH7_CERS8|nr:hypothetical protein CERSUDRAFT_62985 [Gelatoporia subvermispora B]